MLFINNCLFFGRKNFFILYLLLDILNEGFFRIFVFFCLISPSDILAQQLPRYSQYIMNEFLINPAVAGVDGRTCIDLSARKEWLGLYQILLKHIQLVCSLEF